MYVLKNSTYIFLWRKETTLNLILQATKKLIAQVPAVRRRANAQLRRCRTARCRSCLILLALTESRQTADAETRANTSRVSLFPALTFPTMAMIEASPTRKKKDEKKRTAKEDALRLALRVGEAILCF